MIPPAAAAAGSSRVLCDQCHSPWSTSAPFCICQAHNQCDTDMRVPSKLLFRSTENCTENLVVLQRLSTQPERPVVRPRLKLGCWHLFKVGVKIFCAAPAGANGRDGAQSTVAWSLSLAPLSGLLAEMPERTLQRTPSPTMQRHDHRLREDGGWQIAPVFVPDVADHRQCCWHW